MGFHERARHHFAAHDLFLELFDGLGVEVRMRICVIAERHPAIDPLTQERDPRLALGSGQLRFVDEADRRRAMLREHIQ